MKWLAFWLAFYLYLAITIGCIVGTVQWVQNTCHRSLNTGQYAMLLVVAPALVAKNAMSPIQCAEVFPLQPIRDDPQRID